MKLLSVASLLCLLVCPRQCACQVSAPFEVKVIEDSPDRSLECTSFGGFPFTEAIFFRNGIQENTTDNCVSASHNGVLPFNNTPECDGQYFCGKIENSALVLSGPKTVLGKFCIAGQFYSLRFFF